MIQRSPALEKMLEDLSLQTQGPNASVGLEWIHEIEAKDLLTVAERFRSYDYTLEWMTAEDHRAKQGHFVVTYLFNLFGPVNRHLIRIALSEHQSLPSITSIYPSALWFERETWEMFGIVFDGHPQLENLLLPEDADFHPLLKDFSLSKEGKEGKEGKR